MELLGYFIGVTGAAVGGWAGHVLWFKFINRNNIVVIVDLNKLNETDLFDMEEEDYEDK